MHGNAAEWCSDDFFYDLGSAAVTDPIGHSSIDEYIIRGGSFRDAIRDCRSATRSYSSGGRGYNAGLRLVKEQ